MPMLPSGPLATTAWVTFFASGSALLTWLAVRYALSRNLLDQPGARRSHTVATPRGGGVAIVAVMLLAISLAFAVLPAYRGLMLASGIGLLLVAGVGWADDHRPMSALVRLAVHVMAAALLALAVYRQGSPAWVAALAGVLALGLVNDWNFMDGIDGLAASQAAMIASGYAMLMSAGPARALALALLAACCGFLPFNFPRARIFLGDVGSGSLGFALAILIVTVSEVNETETLSLLIPLSAFIFDAAMTLFLRMIRRERWWMPHVQHLYQRWAAARGSHLVVTTAYLAWTTAGVIVMIALDGASPLMDVTVTIAWYMFTAMAWLGLSRQFPLVTTERTA